MITPEMGPAFVEPLPVGTFHGIGPTTSAKINSFVTGSKCVLCDDTGLVCKNHPDTPWEGRAPATAAAPGCLALNAIQTIWDARKREAPLLTF
jgi:hypothetical protein